MMNEEAKRFLRLLEEKRILESLEIDAELLLPLILSIRSGGDWSIRTEKGRSIAIKDKKTILDEEMRGETVEEIYLLVEPELIEESGEIHRIETCGDRRLIVRRPYKVRARAKRIILAKVYPRRKEVELEDLGERELDLEGTLAYGFRHELEHLEGMESGEPIWNLRIKLVSKRDQR